MKYKKRKKLLFISYPFPPLSAAGSIRPFRFAKYLPEFFWKPIVLTIKERDDAPKDNSLLYDLPDDVSIIRTKTFDPYLLYGSYKKSSEKSLNNYHEIGLTRVESIKNNEKKLELTGVKKIKRFLLSLITTPDHQVFWFPFAVIKGAFLILKNDVDAVLTTSPPHSSHFIGLTFKRIFSIPWVADFRDPWTENYGFKEGISEIRYRIEKRLERKIINEADRVIANTKTNKNRLIWKYPKLNKNKFITIHNGFEELNNLKKERQFEKFTIAHIGIFYPKVKPYFFLKAIKKWFEESNEIVRNNTQLVLVGDPNHATRQFVHRSGLNDITKFIDRVPHNQAIEIALNSDLLLISLGFESENSGWVPLKLFDYLNCNKPILAFLPEGEASQIIKDTKTGYTINSEDFEKSIKMLKKEYHSKFNSVSNRSYFVPDKYQIKFYESKYLTKKLAEVLLEVCK